MNPAPSLQGSLWNGNQQLATKKQLISSISGLYTDLQDIELSTIKVADLTVSTLTASKFISTNFLNVSTLKAENLDISGIFFDASGIFFAPLVSSTQGQYSLVSLSTLSLKGIDLGGINLSFDLGLGNAIGGFLGGLGAVVGGAFIGIGTGVGLTIQGLETGLATLINGRGENTITNNTFETINGSTQLQISTLGNAYPLYSTIFRTVSSSSANQEPGPQIFVSSFFQPGTTCVRSVSDPLNLLTGDSNLNTSTIQSFGQWVPFLDPTVTGEDIYARNAYFSSLTISPPTGIYGIINAPSNASPNDVGFYQTVNIFPQTYTYNTTSNFQTIANNASVFNTETSLVYGNQTMDFISTPYNQYTSTIGNYLGGVYFIQSTITSSLTTIPKFIYNGSIFGGANFAICEPDESSFLSTATMDFIAQSSNILIQWGLAVDNRNSTIGVGTAKRVTWDNTANTSNFIDIPQPLSTIVSNTLTTYQMKVKPLEIEIDTVAVPDNGSGSGWAGMAFRVNRATFGAGTTYQNDAGYPYQFNNDVRVKGILEADQLIALSTFTSTNIVTYFSTVQLDADFATIEEANISSLQTTFIGGDQISSFGIEVYNSLSQFSYVSSLIVDFQILEGTNGGTTTTLNKLQTNPGINSFVKNYTLGSFSNLSSLNFSTGNIQALNASITNPTFSTINLSTIQEIGLTSIFNYPGAITAIAGNNTAPFVSFGFKAQLSTNTDNQTRIDYNWNKITGTSNGSAFYDLANFTPTQTAPNLWDIANVQSISTIQSASSNVYFSTTTIPCQSFTTFGLNSTTFTRTSTINNVFTTPDNGDGRQIGALNFYTSPPFNQVISTSGFTNLTGPLTIPFSDKIARIDCVGLGYRNANRVIQAGVSLFINGAQSYSLPLFNQENPFNYLYDQNLSFIMDPRFVGQVNSLDVRFYLVGAPQVSEYPDLGAVYYSLM